MTKSSNRSKSIIEFVVLYEGREIGRRKSIRGAKLLIKKTKNQIGMRADALYSIQRAVSIIPSA